MNTYPIKVRMKKHHLQELHDCEYGSYEDHIKDDERLEEYADGRLHIVEIIERSGKTVVELRDQNEVDEFFAQATSGTFGLYHPLVCLRVFNQLHQHISDAVPEWLRSSGHIGY
jgi:hypothetical protein